jgi:MATE family multidrug resistance protein
MVTVDPTYQRVPRATHARALLAVGLPLAGSQVAQIAISATDTLFMGWYDVTALAALSVASTILFTLFLLGAGFAWAVMPMVASAIATGDSRQVRRVTRMGIWLSLIFSAVGMPVFFFGERLLLGMGQEAEISALGGQYLRIAAFMLPTALIFQVFRSFLSALEHTRIILWGTIAVALANVGLNWVLVFGNLGAPEMGIRGAALASVIVNALFCLYCVAYILRRLPEHTLFRNPWRPDWPAFGQVFRLGWPIGLTTLAEVGLFAGSSILMGWVGEIALAAHGVALQLASITFMIFVGLSQAVTVRGGQAWGRSDPVALSDIMWAGLALAAVGVVLITSLFLFLPDLLIGAFVAPGDPERPAILAMGATLLAVAAAFQLFDASQVMAVGGLRAAQDTRVPMWIAVFAYWGIGMPAAYALGFPLGYGGVGIWIGLTLGLAVAAVLLQWRFWSRFANKV